MPVRYILSSVWVILSPAAKLSVICVLANLYDGATEKVSYGQQKQFCLDQTLALWNFVITAKSFF